jgi:hypothetical protein
MPDRPFMHSRLSIREPEFGWAWLGVGVLAVVGTLAVWHGTRHEDEAARKKARSPNPLPGAPDG